MKHLKIVLASLVILPLTSPFALAQTGCPNHTVNASPVVTEKAVSNFNYNSDEYLDMQLRSGRNK